MAAEDKKIRTSIEINAEVSGTENSVSDLKKVQQSLNDTDKAIQRQETTLNNLKKAFERVKTKPTYAQLKRFEKQIERTQRTSERMEKKVVKLKKEFTEGQLSKKTIAESLAENMSQASKVVDNALSKIEKALRVVKNTSRASGKLGTLLGFGGFEEFNKDMRSNIINPIYDGLAAIRAINRGFDLKIPKIGSDLRQTILNFAKDSEVAIEALFGKKLGGKIINAIDDIADAVGIRFEKLNVFMERPFRHFQQFLLNKKKELQNILGRIFDLQGIEGGLYAKLKRIGSNIVKVIKGTVEQPEIKVKPKIKVEDKLSKLRKPTTKDLVVQTVAEQPLDKQIQSYSTLIKKKQVGLDFAQKEISANERVLTQIQQRERLIQNLLARQQELTSTQLKDVQQVKQNLEIARNQALRNIEINQKESQQLEKRIRLYSTLRKKAKDALRETAPSGQKLPAAPVRITSAKEVSPMEAELNRVREQVKKFEAEKIKLQFDSNVKTVEKELNSFRNGLNEVKNVLFGTAKINFNQFKTSLQDSNTIVGHLNKEVRKLFDLTQTQRNFVANVKSMFGSLRNEVTKLQLGSLFQKGLAGGILGVSKTFGNSINALSNPLRTLKTAYRDLFTNAAVPEIVLSPLKALMQGLEGLQNSFNKASTNIQNFINKNKLLKKTLQSLNQQLKLDNLFNSFKAFNGLAVDFGRSFQGTLSEIVKGNATFKDFLNPLNQTNIAFKNLVQGAGNVGKAFLATFGGSLGIAAGAIGGLTVAIGGLIAGFANLKSAGIVESFNNIAAGTEQGALRLRDTLKEAAAGTISEIELLKSTNLALAGSTGEALNAFSGSLPKLLEIARVQARATGQDVGFLFNSLVTGIKRGSPLLIDNTGLVLKIGEANEAYAQKIGKTVEELSAQEKQIALINATLQAGQSAIDAAGGIAVDNATRLQQFTAMWRDSFNNLGIAFQPVIEVILKGFLFISRTVVPILDAIWNVLGLILTTVWQLVQPLLAPFAMLAPVVKIVTNAIAQVVEFLKQLFNILMPIINLTTVFIATLLVLKSAILAPFLPIVALVMAAVAAIKFFGDLIASITEPVRQFGLAFNYVFKQISSGFIRIVGSILSPFINYLGGFIDRVKTAFSQMIQIILVGSAIAIGSMAEGIVKASAKIIKAVAWLAEKIADFLVGQSPPPKGALSKIDKGGENVMNAWLEGFVGGFSLDPIQQVTQWVTDQLGEINTFSMAQVESALLALDRALAPFQDRVDIVKARLDALKEPAEEAMSILERQQEKLLEAFNAGDYAAVETIRAIDAQKDAIQSQVDAQQDLLDKYQLQLVAQRASQYEERALLAIQKRRLEEATVAQPEAEKAEKEEKAKKEKEKKGKEEDIPELGAALPEKSLTEQIGLDDFGSNLLRLMVEPAASAYGEVIEAQDELATQSARLNEGLSGENLKARFADPITGAFANIGTDIANFFAGVPDTIAGMFSGLGERLKTQITVPLASIGADDITIDLAPIIDSLFNAEVEGSLAWYLANFSIQTFTNRLTDEFETFKTNVKAKIDEVKAFFSPQNATSLVYQINTALNFIIPAFLDDMQVKWESFVENWTTLMSGIGALLNQYFASPVEATFNAVIDLINTLFTNAEANLNALLNAAKAIPFASDLIGDFSFRFPEIPRLSLASVQGMANGGVTSSGLTRVGEKGSELVTSSRKMMVFPHKFTAALDRFNSMMTQSYLSPQMSVYAVPSTTNNYGTTVNNYDQSFNANVNTSNSFGLTTNQLRAMRR